MLRTEQFLQFVEFLVSLRVPGFAEVDHGYQLLTVLLQLLLQSALKVFGIYPLYIVLAYQTIVILLGFLHIDVHVVGNLYEIVAGCLFLLFVIIRKNVVDIGIVNEVLGEGVLVADRKFEFVVNGIDKHGIAQNMPVQRQQERKTAAINTLKESAFAEAHHTLAGTGQIGNQVAFVFGSVFSFLLVQIMNKSVAR